MGSDPRRPSRGGRPALRTARTQQLSRLSPPLVASLWEPDRPALLPHAARSVQLGGLPAARARPGAFTGRDHPALLGDDAAPEVRSVQMNSPYRLVDRA